MCYPSPGPRCSRHAELKLKRCQHALERAEASGKQENIDVAKSSLANATAEFFTTPKGHKYLKAKIEATGDPEGKLKHALNNGMKARKDSMRAYKASTSVPIKPAEITSAKNSESKGATQGTTPKPAKDRLHFTAKELGDELNALNGSGDRFFMPGSLKISSFGECSLHVSYKSYINGSCTMQISSNSQSALIYKDYGDDEEIITEARPSVTQNFSDFKKSPDYGTNDSEIAAGNIADMMDSLDDESKNWNKDTHAVKFMYFGEAHADVNDALRNGTFFNQDAIATLDKVMSEDTLDKETVVYRGIRDYDGKIRESIKAGTYSDAGYLSTSPDPKTASGFSGGGRKGSILMKLVLPAGTKCADLRKSAESEIALPRNFDLSKAQWKFFD
jgi:hypothetical protein